VGHCAHTSPHFGNTGKWSLVPADSRFPVGRRRPRRFAASSPDRCSGRDLDRESFRSGPREGSVVIVTGRSSKKTKPARPLPRRRTTTMTTTTVRFASQRRTLPTTSGAKGYCRIAIYRESFPTRSRRESDIPRRRRYPVGIGRSAVRSREKKRSIRDGASERTNERRRPPRDASLSGAFRRPFRDVVPPPSLFRRDAPTRTASTNLRVNPRARCRPFPFFASATNERRRIHDELQ